MPNVIHDPRLSALPIAIENCQVDDEPIPPEENEYRLNDKPICTKHYGELMRTESDRLGEFH